MAQAKSYTITLSNNATEKEAQEYLLESNPNYIFPDLDGRKAVVDILNLDKRYRRSFDLLIIEGHTNKGHPIHINNKRKITLLEIKSTKKRLPNNPYGFFFGATQNEFDLAQQLGDQYKFCFVCLHPETKSYVIRTLSDLEKIIQNKRVQYQINLQTKKDNN